MKRCKLSLTEKDLLKELLVFVLVQITIAFVFAVFLNNSHQIDINDTKQIDITVDDLYSTKVMREEWLYVVADSTEYLFTARPTLEEYSVSELHNTISRGDRLSLTYCETDHLVYGKLKIVVDARDDAEIYRTFDAYREGQQGVSVFAVILFSTIELIFIGVVLVYAWLNQNIIKDLRRKIMRCTAK